MVCVFPTHVWAFFIFLHDFPGFLMHYQPFEIAGILAYVMAYALFESFIATIFLTLASIVLPRGWLLNDFTKKTLILVVITFLWLISAHFWVWAQSGASTNAPNNFLASLQNDWLLAVAWLFTYIATIIILFIFLNRSEKFNIILKDIMYRLPVITFLFLTLDAFSIGILIIRNI
jgi:hypothetical protein